MTRSALNRRRSPPRSRSPRLNARRVEICITAAHVFVERGFDATSVNDIAAALGVTKAGLYHYFSSKESLLFEIVSLGMDSIDAEVVEAVKEILDPEERLRQLLVRHADLATCNRGVVTRLVDELHALPAAQRKLVEKRKRRYFDLVRGTLNELRAAGKLRDVDTTVAAFSVLGMIIWLPQWFRQNGRLTGEEVATEVAKLALGGLLLPKRRASR